MTTKATFFTRKYATDILRPSMGYEETENIYIHEHQLLVRRVSGDDRPIVVKKEPLNLGFETIALDGEKVSAENVSESTISIEFAEKCKHYYEITQIGKEIKEAFDDIIFYLHS
jgi:hypothetical protein